MTWLRVVADGAGVLWWLRVLVAVAERPAGRWRTGWVGKGLCLVAAVLVVDMWFGFFVPLGAAAVWWRVMVRGRDPFELPMADGRLMR
jgi:hypothetical protein